MNGVDDEILRKLYELTNGESSWYADNLRDRATLAEWQWPGDYSSGYAKINEKLLDKYLNREKFSYNPYLDSNYTSYEKRMKKEGKDAMRDTMAKASELTGGYGSSYASAAGAQAYNSYLEKLYDSVKDFENSAYQRYENEGKSLADKIKLVSDLDKENYNRYRDKVSDYFEDRDYFNQKFEYADTAYKNSQKSVMSLLEKLATLESNDFYKWLNAIK